MGLDTPQESQEKSPGRIEADRIIAECDKKRGFLKVAADAANTPEELKFAVRLAATESEGRPDFGFIGGKGLYITSSVNNQVVHVDQVNAAIDQYAAKQRWVGYGGQIPPFIGERLEALYGPVKQGE